MAVDGITATYIAANQFSVTGDQTDDFHAGRRVKAELTGGDVYSTISGSVFGAVTTVTLYDSELDATLTKVWYGIGWGSVGSLPDHTHDGSEGSGGTISGSGVTDHDQLNNLDFASSGHTGFLAQNGSTQLTGDWNFGSQTISGTGDIWCKDLHTSGNSLYIGNVQLTSAGNVLNYGSNTISGTGDVAAGRLGIGDTVDLASQTEIIRVIAETVGWLSVFKYSDDVGGSAPTLNKARGTYASPAAVQAGDVVGGYNVKAHDGTVFDAVGKVRHLIESISVGNVKSYIEFHVSDSSGVEQEMARLNSTGFIVGDSVDQQADYPLQIKDTAAIFAIDGENATSDAEILLERQGTTEWHILNDATGIETDLFRVYAEGSSFDSLRISNANLGVGIGMTGAWVPDATRLTLVADTAVALLNMRQYVGSASGAAFSGYKARGDDQNSPTVVVAEDVVTGYNAFVYDGSTFDLVGRCRHIVESVSAGDVASYWQLHTSDTAGAERQVVRVDSEGRMWISPDDIATNLTSWAAAVSEGIVNTLDVQDNKRAGSFASFDSGAGGPAFNFYKARGDSVSSPTAVVAEDTATGWNVYAYDGSAFDEIGQIKLSVESISSGDVAAYLKFLLSDTGGTSREVMRIHSTGRLQLYEDGITISNSSSTISGTIRYTGSDFEGYHDGQWITLTSGTGGGTSDHSLLSNLDYASAGHTGFVSIATDQTITGAKTFTQDVTISGSLTATASGTFGYLEVTDSISEIQFTAASGTIGMSDHTDLLTLTSGIVYIDGDLDVYRHVAIGSGATIDYPGFPTLEYLLNINETFGASITSAYGINLSATGAANSGSATVRGISSSTIHTGSGQFGTLRSLYGGAYTDTSGAKGTTIQGVYGNAYIGGDSTTVTNLVGGFFSAGAVFSMTSASGTTVAAGQFKVLQYGSGDFSVDDAYGIHIIQPGATYNGTLTNLYGLYIDDMSATSMNFTNEYNIYSAGVNSINYFQGDILYDGTISGTGDIYCNDIFTASGTVWIGNAQLYATPGGTAVFGGDLQANTFYGDGSGLTNVSGSSTTFLELTDTPSSYTGHAGKSAVVKDDETGLEFVTISGGGAAGALLQDGSTPLTGDWNFGSQTISGTGIIKSGTIWPGAIYTSNENIEVNKNNTGNRYAYIDMIGDDTYTDYGLRLIRLNAGANADSELIHRGTGDVNFRLTDGGGQYAFHGGNITVNGTSVTVSNSDAAGPEFILTGSYTNGYARIQLNNDAQGWYIVNDGNDWFKVYNNNASKSILKIAPGSGLENNLTIDNGKVFIGDSSNTNMTIGLTINMAANTDEAFAIKSSSVAHGMTTQAETDTFSQLKKIDNTAGGLRITGFSATGTTMGVIIRGAVTDEETAKTSSDYAAVLISGATKTGTNFGSMSANTNILAIANNASTVWIVDTDGDTWQAGALGIGADAPSHTNNPNLRIYDSGEARITMEGTQNNADCVIAFHKTDEAAFASLQAYNTGVGAGGLLIRTDDGATHTTRMDFRDDGIIDFGANTISGTGNIYCNDIYTASGTVYIGSESISVPSPGVLDFGGATIQNSTGGGNWVLVDTVTSSGITLDATVSGINGDVDEWLLITGDIESGSVAGTNGLWLRFNGDTASNYERERHWFGQTHDDADETGTGIGLMDGASGGYTGKFRAELGLRSGTIRTVMSHGIRKDTSTGNNYGFNYYGHWVNTADNVTSITLFSSYAMNVQQIKVYRWSD